MFISESLIYLQLQKTGSTHIAALLGKHIPGRQIGKHGPLLFPRGDRLIVGSIRNPWDWYVSLWAYGCLGKGAIYQELCYSALRSVLVGIRRVVFHPRKWIDLKNRVTLKKNHRFLRNLYRSADDPTLFRVWLKTILAGLGAPYLEEGYPSLPLSSEHGLMTFRFLSIFIDNHIWVRRCSAIRSYNEVIELCNSHCIIDEFIKTETLEQDVSRILFSVGVKTFPQDLKSVKIETNPSNHNCASYYYDEETLHMVAKKEKMIIERFGYRPPLLK